MEYSIEYLPLAQEDILYISEYLSQFYPSTLANFLSSLEQAIFALQKHPFLYQSYEKDSFYRRMVVQKYLVFYHVNQEQKIVEIYRILRSAWHIQSFLSTED